MTSAIPTYTFLIYAPDAAGPLVAARRVALLEKHMAHNMPLVPTFIKVGGAMMSSASVVSPDAEKTFVGSSMVIEAESVDAVKAIIEKDPYYTGDVWDLTQLRIIPYLLMTPV